MVGAGSSGGDAAGAGSLGGPQSITTKVAIIPGPKPFGTFPPSLPVSAAPLPLFRALRNKPFAIRASRDI